MDNPNPVIHESNDSLDESFLLQAMASLDSPDPDPVSTDEVYRLLRDINDPEHPLTLEQLNVVSREQIAVEAATSGKMPTRLSVRYTPTIPHCSMATLIGLCIRVRLERCLPRCKFHITVMVREGAHMTEADINKQLADKERVAAALENSQLLEVVNQCLAGPPRIGIAL